MGILRPRRRLHHHRQRRWGQALRDEHPLLAPAPRVRNLAAGRLGVARRGRPRAELSRSRLGGPRERLHQPQHDPPRLEPDARGADAQGCRRHPGARQPEEPLGRWLPLRLHQPRLPLSPHAAKRRHQRPFARALGFVAAEVARIRPSRPRSARKACSTPASAPRPSSARPVLARSPVVASTRAAATPPAVALPVSDKTSSRLLAARFMLWRWLCCEGASRAVFSLLSACWGGRGHNITVAVWSRLPVFGLVDLAGGSDGWTVVGAGGLCATLARCWRDQVKRTLSVVLISRWRSTCAISGSDAPSRSIPVAAVCRDRCAPTGGTPARTHASWTTPRTARTTGPSAGTPRSFGSPARAQATGTRDNARAAHPPRRPRRPAPTPARRQPHADTQAIAPSTCCLSAGWRPE